MSVRIQPPGLFQRTLNGQTLYTHVVISSASKLVFISGQLARDAQGRIVGAGDMRAQITQVGDNLCHRYRRVFPPCGSTPLVFWTGASGAHPVEVRRLSHPGLMVEVEAVAELRE